MELTIVLSWDGFLALVVFYLIFCWGIPMLGCALPKPSPYIPPDQLIPYWRAVFELSAVFHMGCAISILGGYALSIAIPLD